MLAGLTELLKGMPRFQRLKEQLIDGTGSASILQAAAPLLVGTLWRELNAPVLVVSPRPEDARRLYDRLLVYFNEDPAIHNFAELEALPFERLAVDSTSMHQRLRVLSSLAGVYTGEAPLVVTSALGLALKTVGPEVFKQGDFTVRRGQEVSMESLIQRWTAIGYRMESMAESPGRMSRRGGILDVFPPGDAYPSRLEFWGDVVESIRSFDPGNQRSLQQMKQVTVAPAEELLPSLADPDEIGRAFKALDFNPRSNRVRERMEEEISMMAAGHYVEEAGYYSGFFNRSSLLDFLPRNTLVVLDESSQIDETLRDFDRRSFELRETKRERGELPGGFPSPYFIREEIGEKLERASRTLRLTRWSGGEDSSVPFVQAPSFWSQVPLFIADVEERRRRGESVLVVTHHAQRLHEIMAESGLGARTLEELTKPPAPGSVVILRGSLSEGWLAPEEGTALFTDLEVFGTAKMARLRRRRMASHAPLTAEIEPGSYVVHTDHGVALFSGTTVMGEGDSQREYLVLDYAEGDKLYVPTDHADRVGRYSASGDQRPTLTRLGTQDWLRAKRRVRRSVQEMAQELLGLYAQREVTTGIAFAPDTPWERELEDSFPYVETPDQASTIGQVKADMEQAGPMDRLVAGDVGYGKTEVALRAAFKAVAGGKQVAILVPTTVLAQQHYATFSQRLGPYPVTVDVLSRFRSDREQREVLGRLSEGKVDICIGTHRMLQKDVTFKDLGLVVIDEEHRFGVGHKERLKSMRAQVDVLTLTATPIPRTLHMALSGIRNMSTMETPPEERLPIKTYVSEHSDEIVREAVLRELDRGGQIYYLHNRIRNLASVGNSLKSLVPEASVGMAHGRMPEEQLEKVMDSFTKGEFNVLACTTIIESGLDLPGVNTLIVDRADTLGLAQLYQLRGRIGRGNQRAYAYFLIPRGRRITETAQKRLETILAATELGAGFRIAMKDLEIRGAGQLLGAEQSGHIHAVGFDLYQRLLSQAVEEVKAGGELLELPEDEKREVSLNLGLPARIPQWYVEDLAARLELYQRLSKAQSLGDVAQLQGEMWDRFGTPPKEVHSLLYTVRIRALATEAGVESVTREARHVAVRLLDDVGGARHALERELGPHVKVGRRLIRMETAGLDRPWGQALWEMLEGLTGFKDRVASIME